ncbi:MAG: ATP-binding protein [Candidatus Eisenbacteria bacterium]|nr:ATP-binding protein [Candidatus Eisenbacteria bacterium]
MSCSPTPVPPPDSTPGITILVPASTSAVRAAAAAVRGIVETALPCDDADRVEVVVAEVGNNIVVHGFGGSEGNAPGREFSVSVHMGERDLVLEFRDDGPPFDPVTTPPGTPEQSIARGGGGLGLYIMHRVMDELAYQRIGDRNVLRLVKLRPPAHPSC